MTITLIDTHCHLDAEAFHQDLDEVISRATADGVRHLLTIGVTLHTSQAAVVLANRYPNVSAVVGIQPNYAQEAAAGDWDAIVELASHSQVVGIGETGLTSIGITQILKFSETTSADTLHFHSSVENRL